MNEKAAEVDSLYIANCNAQGAYPLAYFPHNIHFLAATAAYEGRGATAINAAYRVASHVDTLMMREPGWGTLQHYRVIPYYVLVKFRQWDHILRLPRPADDLKYPLAVWHYARGMALAGTGQLPAARTELAALRVITRDTTLADITIWEINSADRLTGIAAKTLEAGILRRKGNYRAAIALLREAVALEDQLNYNEPPDWFFSIRHTLGAVLLEDKQYAEAEKVYREDLRSLPENGWALSGLQQSLLGQQKPAEAREVGERLRRAWQYADSRLWGSEIQALAYRQLGPENAPGSYLAGFTGLPFCGAVRQ